MPPQTQEQIAKRAESNRGKKRSEETKKEEEMADFEHEKINLINTYKTMFKILMLIPIRKLAFFFFTSNVIKI